MVKKHKAVTLGGGGAVVFPRNDRCEPILYVDTIHMW